MDVMTLNVGKRGVTQEFLREVDNVLAKHRKVRIKILKSALEGMDKKQIIDCVSRHACVRGVSGRGNTFMLEK
jgi:RNA-binding protein YhbY